jgi:hypothetical protein
MNFMCLIGLHNYIKTFQGKLKNGCIRERFYCKTCEKRTITDYNPNAKHYCPICEKLEHQCRCYSC